MRRQILMAVAVIGVAGAGLGAQALRAEVPPPPPPAEMGPPHGPMGGPMGGPGMHPWMHHRMGDFALIRPAPDRKLAGADVQKIAEGFLLWNGNHDWKITGVTEQDEKTVGFNVATSSGDVIAHFTMDRHTGRVNRVS